MVYVEPARLGAYVAVRGAGKDVRNAQLACVRSSGALRSHMGRGACALFFLSAPELKARPHPWHFVRLDGATSTV